MRSAIKVWTAAQRAFSAAYAPDVVPDDIEFERMRAILEPAGIRPGTLTRACVKLWSRRYRMSPARFNRVMAAAGLLPR